MDFKVDEMWIMKFQNKFCMLNLSELKKRILEEGHMSSFSIHP